MYKKFYYLSIASGLLLIFNNMSFPKLMNAPQTKNLLNKVEQVTGIEIPRMDMADEAGESTDGDVKTTGEQAGTIRITTTTFNGVTYKIVHDKTTGLDWINNKPFVAINGRYYAYRDDQTYMVKGFKYLHKTGLPGNGPNLEAMKNADKVKLMKDPDFNPTAMNSMRPTSIGAALKTLANSQKRMAEQRRVLNKIAEDME